MSDNKRAQKKETKNREGKGNRKQSGDDDDISTKRNFGRGGKEQRHTSRVK